MPDQSDLLSLFRDEMEVLLENFSLQDRKVGSIFFGGGSPSLLKPVDLDELLLWIQNRFPLLSDIEITIEANPEDVDGEKAKSWKKLGVNRVSMGVQSLSNRELEFLRRGHTRKQIETSYQSLRSAGFENISLDLLYGIPNQTVETWKGSLEGVVKLGPEHISAYNLTLEEGTSFFREERLGKFSRANEEVERKMFQEARLFLESKNYSLYEISNFSQRNFESRHNLGYWEGRDYWGIGPSAHSFQRKNGIFRRWWNPKSLSEYSNLISLISKNLENRDTELFEILTKRQHFLERLMTGLRLMRGMVLEDLFQELSLEPDSEIYNKINMLKDSGHLEWSDSRLRLTEEGILISNEVFSQLQ